uniref:Uncharacterized protein n=1 Tax=Meloidogyne hapla TaxID=6305 RepID=A0A1I8BV51_MELHA
MDKGKSIAPSSSNDNERDGRYSALPENPEQQPFSNPNFTFQPHPFPHEMHATNTFNQNSARYGRIPPVPTFTIPDNPSNDPDGYYWKKVQQIYDGKPLSYAANPSQSVGQRLQTPPQMNEQNFQQPLNVQSLHGDSVNHPNVGATFVPCGKKKRKNNVSHEGKKHKNQGIIGAEHGFHTSSPSQFQHTHHHNPQPYSLGNEPFLSSSSNDQTNFYNQDYHDLAGYFADDFHENTLEGIIDEHQNQGFEGKNNSQNA